MRLVLALMLLAGCSTSRPGDLALRRRFTAERDSFVWLRDAIRGESLTEVRTDALVWNGGWIEGRPQASDLARVGKMPLGRARGYLDRLDRIGAVEVQRINDSAEIIMHRSGIVVSGVTKSIVWSRQPPATLVDDTERITGGHGHQCVRLEPDWYIVMEWN
jgi:hypothetical protein